MDNGLKLLAGAACVAIIAAVGYGFLQEWQESGATKAQAASWASELLECGKAVLAAADTSRFYTYDEDTRILADVRRCRSGGLLNEQDLKLVETSSRVGYRYRSEN